MLNGWLLLHSRSILGLLNRELQPAGTRNCHLSKLTFMKTSQNSLI